MPETLPNLSPIFIGFSINISIAFIIVRFLYFPKDRSKSYVFPFMAFNTLIYFILGPLLNTELSIGVGFSLFAIFSILRYRTESMPIREMTYLFVITALPVINGVLAADRKLFDSLIISGVVVIALFFFEKGWGFGQESSRTIIYDKLKLLKPASYNDLLADLRERTGLPITHCHVGKINYARKSAEINIFYDKRDIKTEH
ncbi:MAG: DUF4956 domain-containing protein [Chloroflexi bacterium]|nr:DUF4956 domain-containing protein [Chloroflexota bacterium]